MNNTDGRRWARFTLLLALFISMAGNVTHTFLAVSDISLWLRVPPAALWPVFTFLGIEVLVRIIWQPSTSHKVARALVLFPAIPAAVVSYEHLYSLLLMMGEEWYIALIGPAAIDGAMIGMTIVLLTTRQMPAPPAQMLMEPKTRDEIESLTDEQINEQFAAYSLTELTSPAPVSPAPIDNTERRGRAPRAGNAEREQLVRDMLADPELSTGGHSTMRRYASVARMLRDNPRIEVNARELKVRPEIVENIIRPWAMAERVR